MAFKPWTKEEEDKLIASVHNGHSVFNIAKEHNRSIKAIEMRIENIVKRMFTEGRSVKELSKMIHKTEKEIEQILDTGKQNNNVQNDRMHNIEEMLKKISKRQKLLSEKLDLLISKK